MADKIKPCPFCGEDPNGTIGGESVWCGTDGCPGRGDNASPERWNQRAVAEMPRLPLLRCQKCGQEGLPSPTAILDALGQCDELEARLAALTAENERLRADLNAWMRGPQARRVASGRHSLRWAGRAEP